VCVTRQRLLVNTTGLKAQLKKMDDWEAAEDAGLGTWNSEEMAAAKKAPPAAQDWQDNDDGYEPRPGPAPISRSAPFDITHTPPAKFLLSRRRLTVLSPQGGGG